MELVVALVEHALWPMVAITIVSMFRKQIVTLLDRVNALKAGSVEVRFRENIGRQGFTADQQAAFRSLTADEIDLFLLVSFSDDEVFRYTTNMSTSTYKQLMIRLQDAGLLTLKNPDDPGINLLHDLTPLGKRVRALIVDTTTALLQESVEENAPSR